MKKITFLTLSLIACWQSFSQINPIEVIGFNEDVIANGVGPMSESTSIPIDADVFCYLSEDWKLNEEDSPITVGLPESGLITSPNTTGLTYQIPTVDAPYEGNNSLRIDTSGAENAGTFTFSTPLAYSNLYLLVTSGSGASTIKVTVHFDDDTTQEISGLSVPDWYQTGLPVEVSGIGRGDTSNNNVETPNNNPKLFQLKLDISIANQTKQIESIDIEKTNTGESVFNAVAISGKEATSCLPPFDIVVSDVTMTEAEITWSSLPEITEWEIEFGETGFELGTGTIIEDNDGTIGETLTPINAATQYEAYVKSVCDDGTSEAVGPIAFETPICNPIDQCNYTFVLTDVWGDGWNGNSMNVLQNGILVQTITLGSGDNSSIEIPICDGIEMELYWNTGGNFTYPEEVGIEILDSYGSSIFSRPAGGDDRGTTLFTTTASCPDPPENDNIANAINLVLDAACTGDIYYNVMATAEEGEPTGSCFEPTDTIDQSVWFTFTAPTSGFVEISTDIDPSDFDSQLAVYNAPTDISDLTTLGEAIACSQDDGSNNTSFIEVTGLTAGETYYIQVDGKEENEGNFCIVVNEIACPTPYDIVVSDITMTEAEVSWSSLSGTTEWEIEFGEIGFEPGTGTGTIIQDNDGTIGETLTPLNAATQYDVYVKSICENGTSEYAGPITFDSPICDPADQCNYTFIMTDTGANGWSGNSMDVLQNGILVQTISLETGGELALQVPICDGIEMELFWNTGGTIAYQVGVEILDPYGTSIFSMAPSFANTSGVSLFTTTASCPEIPENDNIANAINLELDAECTGDIYYNVMATSEEGEPTGNCFEPTDTLDQSVWFTFIAPTAGAVEISTDIAPSDFDSQIAVYGAPTDINDLTTLGEAIACSQDDGSNNTSFIEVTGLTAGETYYIQVDGKEENEGNFCIVVNEIPCPDPSNIEITAIMGNSAQVNWTSNGIETAWQIEYGPAGFELGTGTIITDEDEPNYLLTELTIDTGYEVYVSAICDEETSNPIGPVSFATPPCPEDIVILAEEGACGAIVDYFTPESSEGGLSENLIMNPNGEDGLNGWTIEASGADGWSAQSGGFVTSYETCQKSQVITFADAGFTDDKMDEAPEIFISEDYVGTGGITEDTYFLIIELRDADGNVIDSFESENITTTAETQTISHTFSEYGTGVRSIYFSHGGDDTQFWTGYFGPHISNSQVKVNLPEKIVEQIEGIASGEEFPIGATTNVFQTTQEGFETLICTFDVTVLDVENPIVSVSDITVEMNEEGFVSLTPEDLDAGSTDNCEIESMSLDIISLDCNNLGENEIIFTVTDASGNASSATAIVTLVDPNEYCALSTNKFNTNLSISIYPNPAENKIFINAEQEMINTIQIFSLRGQLVKEFAGDDKSQIEADISQLSAGVYFVKVNSKSGQTSVKQVIKK